MTSSTEHGSLDHIRITLGKFLSFRLGQILVSLAPGDDSRHLPTRGGESLSNSCREVLDGRFPGRLQQRKSWIAAV
ncbi:hypothetical protein Mapa_013139 [Marchantia paleacea]|nr:hypothetical protein Mapa_013139 [Marchantia paleacea]